MKLYDLTGQYLDLLMILQDSEIDEQTILDTLDAVDGEIEVKAENYAKIIKTLEAEAAVYKAEKQRLEKLQSSAENRVKQLKQNLEYAMKQIGKTKFKTDLFSFCIQQNGGQAPLMLMCDVEDLPDEFVKKEPNNAAMREYLSNNESDLFMLGERGESLRIR